MPELESQIDDFQVESDPLAEIPVTGRTWQSGSEDISWDQICFVRALDGPRQLEVYDMDDGSKKLVSTSALVGSRGVVPRLTTHWTINHTVAPHLGGDWSEFPITIICPSEKMLQENSNPHALDAIDTYWVGDSYLPEGTVIIHSGEMPEEFRQIPGITFIERKPENQENINAQTVIEKMGYSYFTGDNGHYMQEEGLDLAIKGLREKENISEGSLHSVHLNYLLEKAGLVLGANNTPEMIFSPEILLNGEEDSKTKIEHSINAIYGAYSREKDIPFSRELVQVWAEFAASAIIDRPDLLWQNTNAIARFADLFHEFPESLEIFKSALESKVTDKKDQNTVDRFYDLMGTATPTQLSEEIENKWQDNKKLAEIELSVREDNLEILKKIIEDNYTYDWPIDVEILETKPSPDDPNKITVKFRVKGQT